MASLSLFARGGGSSANNAALNVDPKSQQDTVEITFESGATGDIVLDGNGGDVDPDTTVTIDGVSYNFILEQTGDLPIGNGKVPDALQGSQITVISYIDLAGDYQRLFFVTDGSGTFELMDSFGNGAVALTNVDTTPTAVYICFCGGTDILTPSGYRKVETLKAGDLVVTDTGAAVPILWCGHSHVSVADMQADPSLRPLRIMADAIAPGVPFADLLVSAQHRVVIEGVWTELYFGEPAVLVPAKYLVGPIAQIDMPSEDVVYYHILLEQHEVLISNGLMTESFQPSLRSYNGISPQMRLSLSDAVSKERLLSLLNREDAMCTLKKADAQVLVAKMVGAMRQLTADDAGSLAAA